MAQALCDLQWELQHPELTRSFVISEIGKFSVSQTSEIEQIVPKTPARKESKRGWKIDKSSENSANSCEGGKASENYADLKIIPEEVPDFSHETWKPSSPVSSSDRKNCSSGQNLTTPFDANCDSSMCFRPFERNPCFRTGDFPSPRELAGLDQKFLAKRCNLGYRAGRILKLAQEIVEGMIQQTELEADCGTFSLVDNENLMVHGKSSMIQTVKRDFEVMYTKYAPFQFLAYWSEVWHFYTKWFGNLGEMPQSSYKLITAANMRQTINETNKGLKL